MTPDINVIETRTFLGKTLHQTPILTSDSLNLIAGVKLFFKCENLQKTGSFKARGALNAVRKLSEKEKKRGVITHSSGNHGQALAWAANKMGVKTTVVMPNNAPKAKKEAVYSYGGEIIECEPTIDAREKTANEEQRDSGAVFIPPFNHVDIIEGQATVAMEMLEEQEAFDYILCPIGGGGLISGTALTVKQFSKRTKVVGCEPELAKDAFLSFRTGKLMPAMEPKTIADGLRTPLGEITFPIIKDYVEEILLCSEKEIEYAQKLIMQRLKVVVEPSAAVPFACLLANKKQFQYKKVGIILTGGNMDVY